MSIDRRKATRISRPVRSQKIPRYHGIEGGRCEKAGGGGEGGCKKQGKARCNSVDHGRLSPREEAAAEGHPGECRDRRSLLPAAWAQDVDAVADNQRHSQRLPSGSAQPARREAAAPRTGAVRRSEISQDRGDTKAGTGNIGNGGQP